jgi:hypothetical protein
MEIPPKYENGCKADKVFMCQCGAIVISGSNNGTKGIFPGSWLHIFFIFLDGQVTNLGVTDEPEMDTSTYSSLERVHATPFQWNTLDDMNIVGKIVANA